MDKYKELNRIKAVINSLNEEEFFLSDIAIITEYLRKIYRRKKRKQDYKMKMRQKRCLLIEKRRAIDDKPFLGWLIINKEKYLQIAEKYGGWFSSLKFKELYSEFKNEPITSWGFVNEIKDRYGDEIYGMKKYNSGKCYRAINILKIFAMNGYEKYKKIVDKKHKM